MKLTILGSGTGWIRADRHAPAYLVSLEDFHMLLDIGPGTLYQLQKINCSLNDLSALFISHFHPDHVTDLIPFFFATRYKLGYTRKTPITLISHYSFSDFYEGLKRAFGHWVCPPEGLLELRLINEEDPFSFKFGPFKATTVKVNHNPESLAIRLEFEGKSLIYSGDTGWCEALIELARGCDLLILECANSETFASPYHLGIDEITEIAFQAEPKKLLLSHFYPHSENPYLGVLKKNYDGEIILAEDLLTLTL